MRWGPTSPILAGVFAAIVCAAAALAGNAVAAPVTVTRALLIGAGDYPGLPAELRLGAPNQDVERMARALRGAGLPEGSIEVMSERRGVRPTRAAVLARLAAVARDAQAGEAYIIYFTGHGAQVTLGSKGPEAEVFLAADAAPAAEGPPAGAITSPELRAAFADILSRGADVWFIADSCHAAGLLRSAGRVKGVSARALGLRDRPTAPPPEPAAVARPGWGRLTGFYAADAGSLAVERNLPAGATDAAPSSVFTFALARSLAQGRLRSFRDLALAITSAESEVGAEAPSPRFEGALDRPLPGLASSTGRRFPLRRSEGRLIVDAGALEGFDTGAEVEVLRADGDLVVGRGRVVRAGLSQAEVVAPNAASTGLLEARLLQPSAQVTGRTRGERLLELVQGRTDQPAARDLGVQALLWRSPQAGPGRGRCPANPPVDAGLPVDARPFDTLQPPPLRHCDVVYLSLQNRGAAGVDVSPLYVEATGRIGALGLSGGDSVRIQPGDTRLAAVRLVTRDEAGKALVAGVERLVLAVAPADPDVAPADLRALADPELRSGRAAASLLARFAHAVDGPTRGDAGAAAELPDSLGAVVIAWRPN